MVAGGGAGQTDAGSGGGAGGVLTNIPGLMPATTTIPAVGTGSPNALTVTIGGGGAGEFGPTNPTPSQPGSDTTMSGPGPISLTAVGGGGASATNASPYGGQPGGSGGGGRIGRSPSDGGTGTTGQGNALSLIHI